MPFEPGHKGCGGRKKGVRNKFNQRVEETAQRLNCDPFEILLLYAKGDWKKLGYDSEVIVCERNEGDGKATFIKYVITPELRADCAAKACKYLYSPKQAEAPSIVLTVDAQSKEIEELKEWYKQLKELK